MAATDTIPLTTGQKIWLVGPFIPGILVVFILISLALPPMNIIHVSALVPISLVVMILLSIYEGSKGLPDLISGVALIEEDELVRSWRVRNGASGQFANLGKMWMTNEAFKQGQDGQRFRVCYSPGARRVWSLESISY